MKGKFNTLIQDLKLFDSEHLFKQFRMTSTKLEELLSWVALKIEKSSVRRELIAPEQRLCVTLCYLVTGDAHIKIAASYRIRYIYIYIYIYIYVYIYIYNIYIYI